MILDMSGIDLCVATAEWTATFASRWMNKKILHASTDTAGDNSYFKNQLTFLRQWQHFVWCCNPFELSWLTHLEKKKSEAEVSGANSFLTCISFKPNESKRIAWHMSQDKSCPREASSFLV